MARIGEAKAERRYATRVSESLLGPKLKNGCYEQGSVGYHDQTLIPYFQKARGIEVRRKEPNTASAGSSSSIRLSDVHSGATNDIGGRRVSDAQEARVWTAVLGTGGR